jgi:hypothetical protein
MIQRTNSRPTSGLLREGDEEHESRHALLVELQLVLWTNSWPKGLIHGPKDSFMTQRTHS